MFIVYSMDKGAGQLICVYDTQYGQGASQLICVYCIWYEQGDWSASLSRWSLQRSSLRACDHAAIWDSTVCLAVFS